MICDVKPGQEIIIIKAMSTYTGTLLRMCRWKGYKMARVKIEGHRVFCIDRRDIHSKVRG